MGKLKPLAIRQLGHRSVYIFFDDGSSLWQLHVHFTSYWTFMKFYEDMQKMRGERNLGTEKYPTM